MFSEAVSGVEASLPARGAWVEMEGRTRLLATKKGRSPHGERGLKFEWVIQETAQCVSLPARGAWVEITMLRAMATRARVAPRTGSVG